MADNSLESNQPPSRWATPLALLCALAITAGTSAVLYARADLNAAGEGRPPLPVDVTAYEELPGYAREQHFLGLVEAASRTDVGFEIPGAIASIAVFEGQSVAADTVLATLDTRELEARRSAARALVAQVEADLELARNRTDRQRPLVESGAIPAQTFDDTRLAEQALEGRLAAARAELTAVEISLSKSVLRAPYDAVIGAQHLDAGAVTQPGQATFSLIARVNREARIGVAVEQARRLKPGEKYPLTLDGTTAEATLSAVRSDVNPVSRTVVAIFTLPQELEAFDGEPVSISLPREVPGTGGWLPLSALLEGERGIWTVLRLDERDGGMVATREAVEVLHVSGDRAFVRGTLQDRDRVIADGVHRVAPGTRVRIAEG